VQAAVHVGLGIHYSVRDKNKVPTPMCLTKWHRETLKEIKSRQE